MYRGMPIFAVHSLTKSVQSTSKRIFPESTDSRTDSHTDTKTTHEHRYLKNLLAKGPIQWKYSTYLYCKWSEEGIGTWPSPSMTRSTMCFISQLFPMCTGVCNRAYGRIRPGRRMTPKILRHFFCREAYTFFNISIWYLQSNGMDPQRSSWFLFRACNCLKHILNFNK